MKGLIKLYFNESTFIIFILLSITMVSSGSADIFHRNQFWKQINKYSFGRLVQQLPRYCDPSLRAGGIPETVANRLMGWLLSPVEGVMTYDDTIIAEDLQDKFHTIGDIGMPTVSVIGRDHHSIAFFYSMGLVTFQETIDAARKYCTRKNLKTLYEGSSRLCVRNPGGQGPLTYTISSYRCE